MSLNYDKLFENQRELIESQLEQGEEYKRCLDKDAKKELYNECWVLTSHWRVWSLRYKQWNKMHPFKDKPDTFYVTNTQANNRNVPIHQLVNHYFGDTTAEEKYGAKNCDTHHADEDHLNNRADNLKSIWRPDHKAITAGSRSGKFGGTYKDDEGNAVEYEGDVGVRGMFQLIHDVRKAGGKVKNWVEYSKDGSERIKTQIPILACGTTEGKTALNVPLVNQQARVTICDENGNPEKIIEVKLGDILENLKYDL